MNRRRCCRNTLLSVLAACKQQLITDGHKIPCRLVAVLEHRVYVHALETLELLEVIETVHNPQVVDAKAWTSELKVRDCLNQGKRWG